METLLIYKARSFWLVLAAVLLPIAQAKGFLTEFTSVELVDQTTSAISQVLLVWAYLERIFGKKKLVFQS